VFFFMGYTVAQPIATHRQPRDAAWHRIISGRTHDNRVVVRSACRDSRQIPAVSCPARTELSRFQDFGLFKDA